MLPGTFWCLWVMLYTLAAQAGIARSVSTKLRFAAEQAFTLQLKRLKQVELLLASSNFSRNGVRSNFTG